MKPIQEIAEEKHMPVNDGFGRIHALSELIAQRAFEIFECRGRTDGNDLSDWFGAEAELFHSAHLHLYESDDALAVEAEVPGFHADDLEVGVEPLRLTIAGWRQASGNAAGKVVYFDACANRILRAMDLPMEVDPKKATATLKDGILELALPKANPTSTMDRRTYSIIRAEDARLWTESFANLFGRVS